MLTADYKKGLKRLMPKASVSVIPSKSKKWNDKRKYIGPYVTFDVDFGDTDVTDKEHDRLYFAIKKLFGARMIEMYSHQINHFEIYVKGK